MEEDIKDIIQRKIWTIENIFPQANDWASKANKLPKEARKSIPLFSGDWSEDNIKKYLEKLSAAIRDPLRYKNRKLLEDIGVQTKDIPGENFDDSLGIESNVKLLSELRGVSGIISDIIIKRQILSRWLKEGVNKANEKVKNILDARAAFQRILESTINNDLRDELMERSMENTEFIVSAEDTILKVKFAQEFQISIEYNEKFDEFYAALINVYDELKKLQEDYGIKNEEISQLVKGKPLKNAHELLKKKREDCSEKKSKLLEDWKTYSTTLQSIGVEVPEAPSALHELEKELEKLRGECLNRLGKEGLTLLKFLKGEESFPEQVSKEDIINALKIIQPLFIKFLREES